MLFLESLLDSSFHFSEDEVGSFYIRPYSVFQLQLIYSTLLLTNKLLQLKQLPISLFKLDEKIPKF